MSNGSIADVLVISETTVEVHVEHILNKLHFKSRTQVATRFARHQQLQRIAEYPAAITKADHTRNRVFPSAGQLRKLL